MPKHATLSASSSQRWILCPPSVKASEGYPDQETEYAREGTDAHALCQYKLEKALGHPAEDPTENLTYYNAQMEECADGYVAFVMEKLAIAQQNTPDAKALVEEHLDFSKYVPGGFGTGDCVIVADGTLYIIDYKYGQGVEVSAERNTQMMCYALGALMAYDGIYNVDMIDMAIYQPRMNNISEYAMSREELITWAENILQPAAKLALAGEGEFKAGDHCRFCKARADCRARAEYNLELARYDFRLYPKLTDTEVATILTRIDALISWAEDVKKEATKRAMEGTVYPGFKVVEGRSIRKYTSEKDVAKAVIEHGYNPYEKKLLGLTEMKKLLGKQFDTILGSFIYKPPGKPTLVPESDKRRPINSINEDFGGKNNDK